MITLRVIIKFLDFRGPTSMNRHCCGERGKQFMGLILPDLINQNSSKHLLYFYVYECMCMSV